MSNHNPKYNRLNLRKTNDAGEAGGRQVGAWFMIKAHKYNTSKHPVLAAPAKGRSKVETPLSLNEVRMLEGLVNSLQVDDQTVAFRIALYELQKRLVAAEVWLPMSSPTTTAIHHKDRSEKVSFRINADELKVIDKIAKQFKISNKTVARFAIINMAKGTRSDRAEWRKLSGNCYKLSQGEAANQWKKEKKKDGAWDPLTGSSMEDLKTAHQDALDEGAYENELIYRERGNMALMLRAQGLEHLVYPNRLAAQMDPEAWQGLDDEVDEMDTEFIDRYIFEEAEKTFRRDLNEVSDLDTQISMVRTFFKDGALTEEMCTSYIQSGEFAFPEEEEDQATEEELEEAIAEMHEWLDELGPAEPKPVTLGFDDVEAKANWAKHASEKIKEATRLMDEGNTLAALKVAMGDAFLPYVKQQGIEVPAELQD